MMQVSIKTMLYATTVAALLIAAGTYGYSWYNRPRPSQMIHEEFGPAIEINGVPKQNEERFLAPH